MVAYYYLREPVQTKRQVFVHDDLYGRGEGGPCDPEASSNVADRICGPCTYSALSLNDMLKTVFCLNFKAIMVNQTVIWFIRTSEIDCIQHTFL